MKKILLLLVIAAFIYSCNDHKEDAPPPTSTDQPASTDQQPIVDTTAKVLPVN